MPIESFKELLSKFPYFLNKQEGSNFTTSEHIFNNRFQEIYNDLFKVYLAGKIKKHVLIWKDQETAYDYEMNFAVYLPFLKEISIIKIYNQTTTENDVSITSQVEEVIYYETYEYEDKIENFYYVYSESTDDLIPDVQYKISVKTYEEYEIVKGFPENDVWVDGSVYNHDKSLDEFGVLINLPRRDYIETSDYANTTPPYNNRLTEDDYHYLNRILFYLENLMSVPLPVLEVWKILGIDIDSIQLLNRERILCKMFETSRHTLNGEYNPNWAPRTWEHKDPWCIGTQGEIFLFAYVNNANPIQLQDFTFSFNIRDGLGRETFNDYSSDFDIMMDNVIDESENPFYIVPFIDGVMVDDVVLMSDEKWTLNTEDIGNIDARFIFKCFSTLEEVENEKVINGGVFQIFENDVVSDEILVSVRGCNSADWYVNPIIGDDSNEGDSLEAPFATLTKALTMVEGSKNIISLSNDIHVISEIPVIRTNTNIISCPNYSPTILNEAGDKFFKISQDHWLYLQNVNLAHSLYHTHISDATFYNKNINPSFLNVVLDMVELLALDTDENVDIIFTDDTLISDEGSIMILTNSTDGDYDIMIGEETDGIFILEYSDNPNLIIQDKEE